MKTFTVTCGGKGCITEVNNLTSLMCTECQSEFYRDMTAHELKAKFAEPLACMPSILVIYP